MGNNDFSVLVQFIEVSEGMMTNNKLSQEVCTDLSKEHVFEQVDNQFSVRNFVGKFPNGKPKNKSLCKNAKA